MPEGRCDLILLGWTAFVGFNLISDFLWGPGQRAASEGDKNGANGLPGSTSDLYRGEYRLKLNGSTIEEGGLRMTISGQQTGVTAVQVSSVSIALHKTGMRSTFSAFDADLLFSGVEFADVRKMAATGVPDPQRFPYLGGHSCRLNAAIQLASTRGASFGDGPGGRRLDNGSAPALLQAEARRAEEVSSRSGGEDHGAKDFAALSTLGGKAADRQGSVVGEITGMDCGLSIAFAADIVDIEYLTQKVVHYSIWANVMTILQIRCFAAQMRYTEEMSSAARVSMVCIAMQALMDAYDAFLHLCLGLSSQYMFNTIAVISLFKFVLFSLLEARYLLTIWRHRQPDVFNQGWETVRRELSWLYSRFYGVLVVGLVLLYHNLDHLDLIVLGFQAYWLPQIVHDAWQGSKNALCPMFFCGISVTRTLLVLYLWGCPEGIFGGDLYPRLPGSPSPSLCMWVVGMQAVQVSVIALQRRWGPRWFVPWICMPWAYNYHRGSNLEPGTDCVICMGEIDAEDGRRSVVTPCNHKFHRPCLEQWMDVKMECPTCRTALPPIQ